MAPCGQDINNKVLTMQDIYVTDFKEKGFQLAVHFRVKKEYAMKIHNTYPLVTGTRVAELDHQIFGDWLAAWDPFY